MSSTTPLRRSPRLAEKQTVEAATIEPPIEPKPKRVRMTKPIEPETKFRDLTAEEMKADLELRNKMLPISYALRAATIRIRTNDDFKIIEKAAEKLSLMNRGIIYDSMDGFFISDIIHNSRLATIGDEAHKWTFQACNNFLNTLKNRITNPPTRTWVP